MMMIKRKNINKAVNLVNSVKAELFYTGNNIQKIYFYKQWTKYGY